MKIPQEGAVFGHPGGQSLCPAPPNPAPGAAGGHGRAGPAQFLCWVRHRPLAKARSISEGAAQGRAQCSSHQIWPSSLHFPFSIPLFLPHISWCFPWKSHHHRAPGQAFLLLLSFSIKTSRGFWGVLSLLEKKDNPSL